MEAETFHARIAELPMSPDDSTEEIYSILNTKINKGCLWELVIRCNTCASQLHLTGFSLLHILFDHNSDSKHQKTVGTRHNE